MAYTYGAITYATLYGVSSTYNAYQVRMGYEVQSQNTSANTSTIKLVLEVRTVKSNYITYGFKQTTTLAGTALSSATFNVQTVNTWVTFGTRTITVTHDDYGDYKQTLTGSFTTTGNETYALKSGSASVQVKPTSIARKTTPTLSKASVTLGETITITLPRASSSFTHELYYKVGNSAKTLIAKDLGASYSYTVPLMFANWIENATSGTVIIYCQTYNGSTYIGETSVNLTVAIPSNIVPILSNFTVSEAVSEVASKIGQYLKGKSKLSISFKATGDYASTITTTRITVGTQSYTGTSVTTEALSTTGTLRITVYAKDTRGREASTYKDITVYDYENPYITTFNMVRCSNSSGTESASGTYAKAVIKAGVTNVGNNTATYKIGYKLPTASSYTFQTLSDTALAIDKSVMISGTFNSEQTYDFILTVTDKFYNSSSTANGYASRMTNLETEFVLMEFHNSGTGLSIGKVAETNNLFDVNLQTNLRKGIVGLNASFDELNYCKGVTSNIQTQLDGKAQSHTHPYMSDNPASIELAGASSNGGFIDFHYGKSSEDYTSRIIESSSGVLNVNGVVITNTSSAKRLTSSAFYKGSTTYPVYACRVLYSNTTGTTGTVTLAETSANFTYIIIIVGFSDTGASGSLVVYSPNGKTVDVGAVVAQSNGGGIHRVRYAISGTTMTASNNYSGKVTNSSWSYSSNTLYCKAVLGFK